MSRDEAFWDEQVKRGQPTTPTASEVAEQCQGCPYSKGGISVITMIEWDKEGGDHPCHKNEKVPCAGAAKLRQALTAAREGALLEAEKACQGPDEGYLHGCPCRAKIRALKGGK